MSHVSTIFAALLRSITALTGALVGGVFVAAYILGGTAAEIAIGRPSPTQLAGAVMAGIWLGPFVAALGALVGWLVSLGIRRTRFAGPVSARVVVGVLAVVAAASALSSTMLVVAYEGRHAPRVLASTGSLTRVDGASGQSPVTQAVRSHLTSSSSARTESRPVLFLSWGGEAAQLALDGEILVLTRGSRTVDRVDLRGLDYVSEIHAATATLDGGAEWLAVVVRLRPLGRREVLLVYDPGGTRVRHEMLTSGRSPVLAVAGEPGTRQELVLDVGSIVHYVVPG